MTKVKYDISQAATALVTNAGQSRGELIAMVASYLSDATSNGHTVTVAIDQLVATPNVESLGSTAMIKLYAQVIVQADALAIGTPLGYSAMYTALSRIRRVSGYDLAATLAPIKSLTSVADKTKRLFAMKDSAVVVNDSKPKGKPQPKPKGKPQPVASAKLDSASAPALAKALLVAIKRDRAKLTTKDIETLISTLAELDVLADSLVG